METRYSSQKKKITLQPNAEDEPAGENFAFEKSVDFLWWWRS